MDTRQKFGRQKIYTDEEYVAAEHVVNVLVPSRVMRKLVCRLWLNEVSRQ